MHKLVLLVHKLVQLCLGLSFLHFYSCSLYDELNSFNHVLLEFKKFYFFHRLRDEKVYLGILETLETSWMRRCLARRRWYRLFNAVCVMTRVRHMTANSSNNSRFVRLFNVNQLVSMYVTPLSISHYKD